MNKTLIELQSIKQKQLAKKLAHQCAPLLVGIKISNIFITNVEDKSQVIALFEQSILSYEVLFECKKRVVFLLYHKKRLENHLQGAKQQGIMKKLGYDICELESVLVQVSQRYQCHMSFKEQFPHELGILLGYPHEDVLAFMERDGKECLYTGYWKVYSNVKRAQSIFRAYDHAKMRVSKMVMQGVSIPVIIERYYVLNNKKPA